MRPGLFPTLFVGLCMAEVKTFTTEFAGRPLKVELGRLGGQANGVCVVQYGETTVLVNATMSASEKAVDYLPLQVEYEEKYYAAGKIKGSKWIKREGRPSEEAILAGRLIDRPLRPRFDHNIRNEIQVVATVLSFDGVKETLDHVLKVQGARQKVSIVPDGSRILLGPN